MTSRHKRNIFIQQSAALIEVSENIGSTVPIERLVMQNSVLNYSVLTGIKEALVSVQILSQIYILCGPCPCWHTTLYIDGLTH